MEALHEGVQHDIFDVLVDGIELRLGTGNFFVVKLEAPSVRFAKRVFTSFAANSTQGAAG